MKKKPARKKIHFTLPERDAAKLSAYAKDHGVSRPVAVRRIVKAALKEYSPVRPPVEPKNQLGLFDGIQSDIFS